MYTRSSLKRIAQFIDSQNCKVDEELEELDESHDGEAEPQTENSACISDVLQQLKHKIRHYLYTDDYT